MKKYNVVIWGIGDRTKRYIKYNYFENCNIVGFVDTYMNNEIFQNVRVKNIEQIISSGLEYDFLIIATQYFEEIFEKCVELAIPREKIILTDYVSTEVFKQDLNTIKNISKLLYNDVIIREFRLINVNESDATDKTRIVGNGEFSKIEYLRDYYRYRTFEFVANEINDNDVYGQVAELGVFRGTFSKLINRKFRNRKMYLFDTFEGFDDQETEKEKKLSRSSDEFADVHKNTSEQLVINNMPYQECCVICKGLFPETLNEEIKNEKFAFVSIDVDYEDSIYEGIKFFYPRLSEGGYIFIHDYNSAYLGGVKEAVKKYEKRNGVKLTKVPLADRAGTLVISK